jgi:hypothetical protein
MSVRGAASARWPERQWGVASRKNAVDRVDPVAKAVDDERTLGPLADGVVSSTSGTVEPVSRQVGDAYTRHAIAQYRRNSSLH